MTPAYLDSVSFQIYIQNFFGDMYWLDITHDVLNDISCSYGIEGNGYADRVSSTGQLELILRNDAGNVLGIDGLYTPYLTDSSLHGWRYGTPFKLIFTYEGLEYVKFYGYVANIVPYSGDNKAKLVKVSIVDWMEFAANQPVVLPTLQENKRIEDVVAAILATMPIVPQATEYNVGVDEFSFIFDTITEKTKALSEFQKVAISEMGYIYLKKDKVYGETLVVEGRFKRNYDASLDDVPISNSYSGYMLQEIGDILLQETGDYLLLDEVDNILFDNTMTNLDVEYGTNVINFLVVKVYPRRIDTSNVVLYSITNEIELESGETKTIVGRYRDPSNEAQKVSGKDMIAPVPTTDYTMFAGAGGTGANLTSSLSGTANYGTEGVQYILKNNAGVTGYINKLQARGKGIYFYDSTETWSDDATSQNTYGYIQLTLDQKYQDIVYGSKDIADKIIELDKTPRKVPSRVKFIANTSDDLMRAFLNFDVGTMIYLRENQTGIDNYFYIHQVEFKLGLNGIIDFSWLIKEKLSMNDTYWILGNATFGILGSTTILGY
jgi:hypothetical protein